MTQTPTPFPPRRRLATRLLRASLLAGGSLASGLVLAQAAKPPATPIVTRVPDKGWQVCQTLKTDAAAQLQCYQQWAESQSSASALPPEVSTFGGDPVTGAPSTQVLTLPALSTAAPDGKPVGCRNNKYSELSKFWELQRGSDCDNFSLRGYRPITLALVTADTINTRPTTPAPDHTVLTSTPYTRTETKIQLSVRTKLAKGLLKSGTSDQDDQDSLWFGYTQQSYWQMFNGNLSRPFRSTDHEPELIYIYPHQIALPGGWSYRLSGLGLVHQSNGQSDPLSRSWNRAYLMGAAEKILGENSSITVQGRIWDRLRESSATDDNPGIENYIGRAEVSANWQVDSTNTLGLTVRHSLRKEARGSTRLDWMIAPKAQPTYTGLRYHVQLFSGYGDSLIDWNNKRNVISVGFSLVDW